MRAVRRSNAMSFHFNLARVEHAKSKATTLASLRVYAAPHLADGCRHSNKTSRSVRANALNVSERDVDVGTSSYTAARLVARGTGHSFREVAEVASGPISELSDGEVLVRVHFAGINGGCETFRVRGEHSYVSIQFAYHIPSMRADLLHCCPEPKGRAGTCLYSRTSSVPCYTTDVCFVREDTLTLRRPGHASLLRESSHIDTEIAFYRFASNVGKRNFQLGAEGSGEIVAVGPGVESLHPGQAVACNTCGFAELAVVRESFCVPVRRPSAEAAALVLSGVFACVAIDVAGKAQPGDTVFITAGGGAAGSFAIQFAKLAGARVVTTVGSEAKAALAKSLGADVVLNHRQVSITDALPEACPNGIDIAMEGVGGAMFDSALSHLAPGGRLLVSGYISEYPHATTADIAHGDLPPLKDIFWKNMKLDLPEGKVVTSQIWSADWSQIPSCKAKVFQLYGEGKLKAVVDQKEFTSLEDVPDAVDYMLSGAALGKVVVKLAP